MDIKADRVFDEQEAAEYIRLKLLQEEGIELAVDTVLSMLAYEEDYLVAKGIAFPTDGEEEEDYV